MDVINLRTMGLMFQIGCSHLLPSGATCKYFSFYGYLCVFTWSTLFGQKGVLQLYTAVYNYSTIYYFLNYKLFEFYDESSA